MNKYLGTDLAGACLYWGVKAKVSENYQPKAYLNLF